MLAKISEARAEPTVFSPFKRLVRGSFMVAWLSLFVVFICIISTLNFNNGNNDSDDGD